MHPAFLSYLGLWEVLITVSSIGHHYCHGRRIHRFLISSLHFPFGSANDFKNKEGAGQTMDEQVQVSCYRLPFRPTGMGHRKVKKMSCAEGNKKRLLA
ncbi:hypothetical protein CDAR_216091 [Caerostris darwini]|uniref:Secreted protein n=1 Tax=Caerostris darwini TaxID=1538125 RepID=A0AAV4SKM1_9ARAC|nr:hypothetical protein CDAR_216091 [Caerostris darwini]